VRFVTRAAPARSCVLIETGCGVKYSEKELAIYAVDPDIPRDRQRLTLRARAAARTAARGHWFEFDDGTRLRADAPQLWPPTPGRHEMALVDAQGTEIDRVRFEVRGLRRPGSGLASSR